MISFKNRREQVNMQGAAQRAPRHTNLVGEVRATTKLRWRLSFRLVGTNTRHRRLAAQQGIGGNQ
jgi:hypothetical protein